MKPNDYVIGPVLVFLLLSTGCIDQTTQIDQNIELSNKPDFSRTISASCNDGNYFILYPNGKLTAGVGWPMSLSWEKISDDLVVSPYMGYNVTFQFKGKNLVVRGAKEYRCTWEYDETPKSKK